MVDEVVGEVVNEVRRDDERSRYEIVVGGKVAGFADYELDGTTWTFPHTVIDPTLRGRGLGAELVRGALDDVRRAGGTVVPRCWYVARFIDEHPGYDDLVAA